MLPTIESVIAKIQKLPHVAHVLIPLNLQEYVNRPYNVYEEWCLLQNLLLGLSNRYEQSCLIDPLSRLVDEIYYLLLCNKTWHVFPVKQWQDLAINRCKTGSLFEQYVACPSKLNETTLLNHFAQTFQWLNQLVAQQQQYKRELRRQTGIIVMRRKQYDEQLTHRKGCIQREIDITTEHRKQFSSMMTDVYSRLVDTYLGLLPLKLDVWTVLFIVSQLPEFDLVYDGAKVRIYERMRLFQENCLAKVVGRSYCSVL